MLENVELRAEAEIDTAATELIRGQFGTDPNFAFGDISLDVDVGKDHEYRIHVRTRLAFRATAHQSETSYSCLD